MSDYQNIDFNNVFASWQNTSAFNAYWTYSYINNAPFYSKIKATFYPFMQRFVQNWLWWYDGWVPYFHNSEQGIMSTRIASALVDRTAKKISGGRIAFKNAFDENKNATDATAKLKVNPSLSTITKWAADTNFTKTVKNAVKFAEAAGTALVKVNKGVDGKFTTEALRFDRFLPCVEANGDISDVTIFLLVNIDLKEVSHDKQTVTYALTEHRYFGDYTRADGKVEHNVPCVQYDVQKYYGVVTNGVNTGVSGETMRWVDLPAAIKKILRDNYTFELSKPIRLPFTDWLGCELVTATESVGSLPELPFGESLLSKILPFLQAYDYYFSAFCTDMYIAKGRVLVPKGLSSPNAQRANSGLDQTVYEKVEYINPDAQVPVPIQFQLRAEEWRTIRNTLIENIAVNTGLSSTTVASFLNDNSAKTAREISTEENETADFVENARAVIEVPLNKVINKIGRLLGCLDTVVIRWSQAGLTNKYTTAEILSMALQGGFISKRKAVATYNSDDDDIQVQEEYDRILEDEKNGLGTAPMQDDESGGGYFGEEEAINDNENAEPTGDSD